eukprot:CAMPEP_0173172240 /NCGR_PEP_ID=MMETSP1141-20130122/2201_1 /TAXON_ID=483371 /ORGANISM="non described non described, Strain CCMP2298" /LENGTH=40 /DNA_ID= /DNA_START= /DNA_END= /DNA_ORIENTATION=
MTSSWLTLYCEPEKSTTAKRLLELVTSTASSVSSLYPSNM